MVCKLTLNQFGFLITHFDNGIRFLFRGCEWINFPVLMLNCVCFFQHISLQNVSRINLWNNLRFIVELANISPPIQSTEKKCKQSIERLCIGLQVLECQLSKSLCYNIICTFCILSIVSSVFSFSSISFVFLRWCHC